mmetsp:Transcript_11727/g.28446  ORF Transcript_11727/g.28446 Transcript_11727/m.28446 type:complete len:215 (-) Transcript_11727:29-673(-)
MQSLLKSSLSAFPSCSAVTSFFTGNGSSLTSSASATVAPSSSSRTRDRSPAVREAGSCGTPKSSSSAPSCPTSSSSGLSSTGSTSCVGSTASSPVATFSAAAGSILRRLLSGGFESAGSAAAEKSCTEILTFPGLTHACWGSMFSEAELSLALLGEVRRHMVSLTIPWVGVPSWARGAFLAFSARVSVANAFSKNLTLSFSDSCLLSSSTYDML